MEKNHLGLLCDVGELIAALSASRSIESFLEQIVQLASTHLRADVCSIYIFDEDQQGLVLKATKGLNPALVNKVHLQLREGLVGECMASLKPVIERKASANQNFKMIAGLLEEGYESFLAVPIHRGPERVGVLVVQRAEEDYFESADTMALRALASQLAGAIETAKSIFSIHEAQPAPSREVPTEMTVISAQVASEGSCCGSTVFWDQDRHHRMLAESCDGKDITKADFENAIEETFSQLEKLQRSVQDRLSEMAALIFSAHVLMLQDPEFTGEMRTRIEAGESPPLAVAAVTRHYVELFGASPNAYIREKANDVEDLGARLMANTLGAGEASPVQVAGKIAVAHVLHPSDMLRLVSEGAAGVVMISGGITSHLSILGRSLGIPMMIADSPQLTCLSPLTEVLMDDRTGRIYIQPTEEVKQQIEAHRTSAMAVAEQRELITDTTETADGVRVRLMANVNLLLDAQLAGEMKMEGVGLYRSEFPFMIRNNFPSEEEQVVIYRKLFAEFPGRPVTIRTLDVGGDKVLNYYEGAPEANPVLGLRSIRFSMQNTAIFHQQIRGILRAGADCERLRIMFPMISATDEFIAARAEVEACMMALRAEDLPFHEDPEIGMMVEIPSVLEVIDDLAGVADFFCIGTNDFIQFLLAVDRSNEKVAGYYLPHHPAVLRSLSKIVQAAKRAGIPVSVCGEMAHEAKYVPFLVGIGVRELSIDPHYMLPVQQQLAAMSAHDAERTAWKMLEEGTIKGVEAFLEDVDG